MRILTQFDLCYTMSENVKNKENVNFVHIVYLMAKLCNIFDEAFFIDVRINMMSLTFEVLCK